jgi:hypothetical protein
MACLLWQCKECRDISERWIICDLSRPRSGEQSARDIVREAHTALMPSRTQSIHSLTRVERSDGNDQPSLPSAVRLTLSESCRACDRHVRRIAVTKNIVTVFDGSVMRRLARLQAALTRIAVRSPRAR